MRRSFAGLATAAALALSGPVQAQIVERPIDGDPVRVAQGSVSGSTLASGVRTWLGVPFAAPPVRDLRWKPPEPATNWVGVRQAVAFPPMCPQGMRGPGQNHYFGDQPTAEDCLYLNIWAPPVPTADNLPVIVWIYGGGFSGGSSSMMWTRGETIASKGAIYVTLNYRLGALGFMAHPQLTAESPHGASGNYGLMDQVAGIRWVRDNIAAFGGDPNNITIVGQSAGSMSVSAVQASPLAAGLFKRVVGMSGSVLGEGAGAMGTRQAAEQSGLQLQEQLGAASLADLRRLPADRIVGVRGVRNSPIVDGWFMPQDPREIYAAGRQNPADVWVGFTRDEAFSQIASGDSREAYEAAVRRTYPDQADEFLRRYPADANWQANARAAARDVSLGTSMNAWAQAQARTGQGRAYGYMFSQVHPYAPGVTFIDHNPATAGAYHAGELTYFFGNQDAFNAFRTTRNWTEADRQLSDVMSSMLVAFARTGDPSLPGMTVPQWSETDLRLVEFGEPVRIIPWPGREHLGFLAGLRAAAPPPPQAPATAPARMQDNAGPRF